MTHIDCLLTAFPDTPWLFLYRNPVEVLVSHQRMPGWHTVPGSMADHGLHAPEELMGYPLGYGAWILSTVLKQARLAKLRHDNGLLVNYSELPHALKTTMAEHFSIKLDNQDTKALRAVTENHAKQRQVVFQPDAADKRATADSSILELADHYLNEPYQALEQLRNIKPGD